MPFKVGKPPAFHTGDPGSNPGKGFSNMADLYQDGRPCVLIC